VSLVEHPDADIGAHCCLSVDLKDLKTYQQLFVYFIPLVTNVGFINAMGKNLRSSIHLLLAVSGGIRGALAVKT
jgi:hypothetical protein